MRVSARRYLAICGLQLLLVSNATFSFAQVDPTKALVGTWIGTVSPSGTEGNGRTIVIDSVKAKEDGGWMASGNFAITGEKFRRMTYSISLQDGDIILEFITGPKNPARLKLVGERKLEGTLTVWVGSPGVGLSRSRRTLHLEKVEPKSADVK